MVSIIQPSALIPLSRYITEKPQEIANSASLKATMYLIASVISGIAATAILGGMTAVFLGLVAETSLSGWAVASALAMFIASMLGVSTFSSWKREETSRSEIYQAYAATLQELLNKGTTEENVKHFFRICNINTNRFSEAEKTLLAAEKPGAPLTALFPLIARYLVTVEQMGKDVEIINEQHKAMQHFNENDPLFKMHIDQYKRSYANFIGHNHEAAFYLQCLMQPSLAAPTDSKLFETIHALEKPKFSSLNFYNLFKYGKATPEVSANGYEIAARVSPLELRRLLFA